MSCGFRRFIWKKLTLEFKGLTWKLALGFRGFIGKKKVLGLKGLIGCHCGLWRPLIGGHWLAAILDCGGHFLFPFLNTKRFPPSIPLNLLTLYYWYHRVELRKLPSKFGGVWLSTSKVINVKHWANVVTMPAERFSLISQSILNRFTCNFAHTIRSHCGDCPENLVRFDRVFQSY